jgi:hypothetical protein
MDPLITLCIFITILFLYIHIANQFKKGEELEIYETDYNSLKHLEDVCELKQPFLMNMSNVVPSLFSNIVPENIAKYSSHDINMKDCNDYFLEQYSSPSSVDPIILPFNTTIKFLESDKLGHLFSENNQEFLDETNLLKKIKVVDDYLKPSFIINNKYDLLFGSCNTVTPLRYHTDSRQFLFVTNGKIKIKMTPWKSTKFLHPYNDYENYEFRSLVHPTKPHKDFSLDFEKTKFLEFEVNSGYMLYIPPYWWYSIIYLDNPSTFVCNVTYNSIINCVSNIKNLSLYLLQQQNITKKINNNKSESIIKNEIIQNEENLAKIDSKEDINPIQNELIQTDPVEKTDPIEKTYPIEKTDPVEKTVEQNLEQKDPEEKQDDGSLNPVIIKDPLKKTEKENITYSISNI